MERNKCARSHVRVLSTCNANHNASPLPTRHYFFNSSTHDLVLQFYRSRRTRRFQLVAWFLCATSLHATTASQLMRHVVNVSRIASHLFGAINALAHPRPSPCCLGSRRPPPPSSLPIMFGSVTWFRRRLPLWFFVCNVSHMSHCSGDLPSARWHNGHGDARLPGSPHQ